MKTRNAWYIFKSLIVLLAMAVLTPTAEANSLSTVYKTYSTAATESDVVFSPDNGIDAEPTIIPLNTSFVMTFNGTLYTYVDVVELNNVKVTEEYLADCFKIVKESDGTEIAFNVSLDQWAEGSSTIVSVTPIAELESETAYTLQVLDDKLQLGVKNVDPLGNGDFVVEVFAVKDYVTEDVTAPILDVNRNDGLWGHGMYPERGGSIVVTDSLMLDFVEPVMAGAGEIRIYTWNGILAKTIDASTLETDPNDQSIIVLTDMDGMTLNREYYVVVPAGAITDLAGNDFAGISVEDNWYFNLHTDEIPDILDYSPRGTGVAVDTDLMIHFDTSLQLGDAGTVNIYRQDDGTLVQSLSVVDDEMFFSFIGYRLYIDIDDLDPETAYMVSLDAGAIESRAGIPCAEISTDDWRFETEVNRGPALVSLTPPDNSIDVPLDQQYVMEFDMDVQAGSGLFELHADDGMNTTVASFGPTDPRVTISGTTVSVDLTGLTEMGTDYFIIVYYGFVTNTSPTPENFHGIRKVFDWNFTTVGEADAPQLLLLSPDNGEVIANNHPDFVMTFNEAVQLSDDGGYVYVYAEGDLTPRLTIPLTEDMFTNNVVNISYVYDPVIGGLDKNTNYYVFVDAGAIVNANGGAFAGIADETEWTFTTGDDFALGVDDEFAGGLDFSVYPNPFNDVLYINNSDQVDRLFITNVVGQRVKEISNPANMISTSDLRNGIYFITLMLDDESVVNTQRIIKR